MATKFVKEGGSYSKTVEDSSHQASNKFSNPMGKSSDSLWKDNTKINAPKDSGKGAADTENVDQTK